MKGFVVSSNEKGRCGMTDADGKEVIPFLYDEITPYFKDGETKYFCRLWLDYDWRDSQGNILSYSRKRRNWIKKELAHGADQIDVSNVRRSGIEYSLSDEGLDCVPDDEEDGLLHRYKNGKFGVYEAKTGAELLPCDFDEVQVCPDCDVIYCRRGNKHSYHNRKHEQILTNVPCPEKDSICSEPYYLHEKQDDIALMTMQFVDSCSDNQCCLCYGRPTRLDRIPRETIESLLRKDCQIKPFDNDAFLYFNSVHNYIYRGYIVEADSIPECLALLEKMKCYQSTWLFIDKFTTNPKTPIADMAWVDAYVQKVNDW